MRLQSQSGAGSVRRPAFAGRFYPSDPGELRRLVERCLTHPLGPGRDGDASGQGRTAVAIAPHAGLTYSGPIAAHAHRVIAGSPTVIVVGPNHTGIGPAVAISSASAWRTPLGDVPVQSDVRKSIAERCPFVALDDRAHESEHSIEVQLPFISTLTGPVAAIVPISLRPDALGEAIDLGRAIGDELASGSASLLATTDLSHYLSQEPTQALDGRTIADILSGDSSKLAEDYRSGDARLCGLAPVVVAMTAAARAGLNRGRVLARCTSADTGGPVSSVVGYVAIAFYAQTSSEDPNAG